MGASSHRAVLLPFCRTTAVVLPRFCRSLGQTACAVFPSAATCTRFPIWETAPRGRRGWNRGGHTAGSPMGAPAECRQNNGRTAAARSRAPSHESGRPFCRGSAPFCHGSAAVLPHRAFTRFFSFAAARTFRVRLRPPSEAPASRTLARWRNGRTGQDGLLEGEWYPALCASKKSKWVAISGSLF